MAKYIQEKSNFDRLKNVTTWILGNMPRLLKDDLPYIHPKRIRQEIRKGLGVLDPWHGTKLPELFLAGDYAQHGKVIGRSGLNLKFTMATLLGRRDKFVEISQHNIDQAKRYLKLVDLENTSVVMD